MAGQYWPWGDPHGYPHAPHPLSAAAEQLWLASRPGIEMRVGPVAITNGVFGNRPHCIYRGFCLQGCKVNAKASPLVTHVPDAIEHGVEIRADAWSPASSWTTPAGAAPACSTTEARREHFQRAAAVAVCGYSIETPRLLLNSRAAASRTDLETRTTRSAAT